MMVDMTGQSLQAATALACPGCLRGDLAKDDEGQELTNFMT